MPNKPESNINWDLYIQDVNSVYITQNKTAEETIQFLREKHNLELRCVKCSFLLFYIKQALKIPTVQASSIPSSEGLKNIMEMEWMTGIIPVCRKRALEGKDSDVYLHGNKLGSKKLKKGFDRYSYGLSQNLDDLDTSAGISFYIYSDHARRPADCDPK